MSVESGYQVEWGAAARRASLSGLKVVVEDLSLARRRDRSRAIQLPRVEVSGGEVDLLGRAASIAEVKTVRARLQPRRDADGKMALLEMLALPRPARPAAKSAPPWRWSVRPDVACPLTASLRWGEKGRATVTGTVWPFAARAELAVQAEELDLAPLGPYLDGAAPVRLAEARLGLGARTTVDPRGAAPVWTFADPLALRRAELERRLRRAKAARMRPPPAEDAIDALALLPEERPRLVEALYSAANPPAAAAKPAKGAAVEPPPSPAEQEARLLEAVTLKPEDVPALLAARHAAAREALVAAGVEAARLFTVQGGERASKESGARVYFTVR